jgi:hypothetical protein
MREVFRCAVGLWSMLLLVSAGSAHASATVRFVHAVPGAGAASLNIAVAGGGVSGSPVSFGSVGRPLEVDAGLAKLTVAPATGSKALATAETRLADGARYTVVAEPRAKGSGAELRVYRDGRAVAGEARFRAINAGPEVGRPDVRVGGRVVAEKLAYGSATDYVQVPPGTHDVTATRAGGAGGALAVERSVPLTVGTATTAVIVGSGGERTRILTLSDGTAAPSGAPATGFGGLAPGDGPSRLLVALMSAFAAAGLGAAGWVLTGRR